MLAVLSCGFRPAVSMRVSVSSSSSCTRACSCSSFSLNCSSCWRSIAFSAFCLCVVSDSVRTLGVTSGRSSYGAEQPLGSVSSSSIGESDFAGN